ncbi:MAG: DUF4430 domain-containing protein [Eggerthellaceae bacterium]|nr:DUF4430 domain-containing protein [Eggerthellaceae bacterium]
MLSNAYRDSASSRACGLAALAAVVLCAALALGGCAAPAASDSGSSSGSAAPAAAGTGAVDPDPDGAAALVTVTLSVPEGTAVSQQEAEVGIAADGTVYDALVATGWPIETDESNGTMFVTSIDGIANGSQGAQSGWVYTVNGESVMEACDDLVLANGDTVEWQFFA